MGQPKKHPPVKLIIGFIFRDKKVYNLVKPALMRRFGSIDFESAILPFTHTDYYKNEFGSDLKRAFISFKSLILPEKLSHIKIITNALELKISRKARRSINIDPGYLELSKLVLATTKNYTHRLCIGKNIFAEVTLWFGKKSFQTWEWTYPDYKTPEYIKIFNNIREIYKQQILD